MAKAKLTTPALRINWSALRLQKSTLVKAAVDLEMHGQIKKAGHLDGIIHIIDAIQDNAVDKEHVPEKTVFGRLR